MRLRERILRPSAQGHNPGPFFETDKLAAYDAGR